MRRKKQGLGIVGNLCYGISALIRQPLILRCSFLRLYAIECSRQEVAQLMCVESRDLDRLAHIARKLTGSCRRLQPVELYCFGSAAPSEKVGSVLPRFADGTLMRAAWSWESRLGALRFVEGLPVQQVILHEVAHALLDGLTDGFPYPLAILEGYADLMESMILAGEGRGSENRRKRRGTLDGKCPAGECTSLRDLLQYSEATQVAAATHTSLALRASWLIGYVGYRSQDVLRRMLRDLREDGASTPLSVYAWLAKQLRMSSEMLEQDFRSYHAGGCPEQPP